MAIAFTKQVSGSVATFPAGPTKSAIGNPLYILAIPGHNNFNTALMLVLTCTVSNQLFGPDVMGEDVMGGVVRDEDVMGGMRM